ncbi:hypothetical protein [Clostridium sp. CM027]|nr:hypothetical protein [Clostridium sp. CM027]
MLVATIITEWGASNGVVAAEYIGRNYVDTQSFSAWNACGYGKIH